MAESMKSLLELGSKVADFHHAFKIGNAAHMGLLSLQESTLRYTLMREENEEYLEACQQENLVQIADALGDQLYVLLGTALRHGLLHKMEEIFLEIHRSNMSKLDQNGMPIYREDGKVLKSPQWTPPDLLPIILADGQEPSTETGGH